MVLVDSSVWVAHLWEGNDDLARLLEAGDVICHPLIVGELACGNLKNRTEILSLLQSLPMAMEAEHEEVLQFIEEKRLMGRGLGYIDAHLMASSALMRTPLWTFDKRLNEISKELAISVDMKSIR
jgi:predicted nucleic acid-binding protein